MKLIRWWLLAACTNVTAQTAPTEFPPEALPLAPAALQEAISGKVFSVKLTDGTSWRLDYKANGYFFINTSRGFADKGTWTVQESKLCGERQRAAPSCSEMRQLGKRLFMQHNTGEVVEFLVQ
jgi:hypothetical protein